MIFKIRGQMMDYPWGNIGPDSLVYRLARIQGQEDRPAAELWFGAHRSAPSSIIDSGETLATLIEQEPAKMLGKKALKEFGSSLPFLFKILSIRQPLSIQAHPNREQAKELHQRDPQHFPDPNHKPEIAIAITPVSLFSGFLDDQELRAMGERFPALKVLNLDSVSEGYAQVMRLSPSQAESLGQALLKQLELQTELGSDGRARKRILEAYPTDRGAVSTFFLRFQELQPGEAVFTPPNTVHAYISGELAECMANSDNVIRGGLTQKHIDVPTLLSVLNYSSATAGRVERNPTVLGETYHCPAAEFQVERIVHEGQVTLLGGSPTIVSLVAGQLSISTDRQSLELQPGEGVFIPACCASFNLVTQPGVLAFLSRIPDSTSP